MKRLELNSPERSGGRPIHGRPERGNLGAWETIPVLRRNQSLLRRGSPARTGMEVPAMGQWPARTRFARAHGDGG